MFLAWNEIRKNRKKFYLIVSIIVLISYLVFFLFSLAHGLSEDKISAVKLWNAKEIVLQEGSNKNILASQIDKSAMDTFKDAEPAAVDVYRIAVSKVGNNKDDDLLNIVFMGVEKNSKLMPKVIEGRMTENDHEVVATKALAEENKLKIGDQLKLSKIDETLTIVGFTQEAKFLNMPVVYGTLRAKEVLSPKNPAMGGALTDKVSGLVLGKEYSGNGTNDFEVVKTGDFIEKLPGYHAEQLTFYMMIGFLMMISAIVLGVFLYIITLQKKTTFAIMKIQGISNSYIGKSVFIQTGMLAALGVIVGMVLAVLTGLALPPAVPFKIDWLYYLAAAVIMLVTPLLGAAFSVKSVAKIDPLRGLK